MGSKFFQLDDLRVANVSTDLSRELIGAMALFLLVAAPVTAEIVCPVGMEGWDLVAQQTAAPEAIRTDSASLIPFRSVVLTDDSGIESRKNEYQFRQVSYNRSHHRSLFAGHSESNRWFRIPISPAIAPRPIFGPGSIDPPDSLVAPGALTTMLAVEASFDCIELFDLPVETPESAATSNEPSLFSATFYANGLDSMASSTSRPAKPIWIELLELGIFFTCFLAMLSLYRRSIR